MCGMQILTWTYSFFWNTSSALGPVVLSVQPLIDFKPGAQPPSRLRPPCKRWLGGFNVPRCSWNWGQALSWWYHSMSQSLPIYFSGSSQQVSCPPVVWPHLQTSCFRYPETYGSCTHHTLTLIMMYISTVIFFFFFAFYTTLCSILGWCQHRDSRCLFLRLPSLSNGVCREPHEQIKF